MPGFSASMEVQLNCAAASKEGRQHVSAHKPERLFSMCACAVSVCLVCLSVHIYQRPVCTSDWMSVLLRAHAGAV